MAQTFTNATKDFLYDQAGDPPAAQIKADLIEVYASSVAAQSTADTAIGQSVKLIGLSITPASVAAGAGAKTVNLGAALANDAVILAVGSALITPWSGGALSAMTLSVGTDETPDVDALLAAIDVFTGADPGPQAAAKGAQLAEATYQPRVSAAVALTATLNPTGDEVTKATAGESYVWVLYRDMA